jgi:O-Antigen ligase
MEGARTLPRPSGADPRPPEPPARRRGPELLIPAFVLLACGIVLGPFDGGYARTVWSPIALFLLALLLLVLLVAPPARADRSRLIDIALLALGAFTLWSYASILWADVPGDAWEGANRTAVYLLGFAIVALRPWPVAAARWALMLVAWGLAVVAGGVVISTATAGDVPGLFIEGRLSEPIGYANALAALWLIGFWPAVHLAVTLELGWAARAVSLGAATVLLTTSLLSQSRGSALGFAVTAVVFLLLHPRRWAALAALAVPLAFVAVGWDTLTRIRQVADSGALTDALADARQLIVVATVVAVVACAAAVLLARRLLGPGGASPSALRAGDRAFLGMAAAAAVAGVVVLALSGNWLDERWESFKNTDYGQVEAAQTRFTGSLGSGRYDFYRVALDEFADHPVAGIGAENFAVPYLEQRRTLEAPRYVHSLPLSILVQLGLVGALLALVFAGAIGAAIARVRRTASPAASGVAIGALGGALAWLVHGGVDWLWEFPALSLTAAGLLAIAARVDDREITATAGAGERILRAWPVRAIVGLTVIAVGISLALPGASARYERQATKATTTDGALSRLERAATLDPLSADPLVTRAVVARNAGRPEVARQDLRDALEREPRNWFAHLELALLDAQQRRWPAAERELRRARQLNPGQAVLAELQTMVENRQRIDPTDVERVLAGQLDERLRPFETE